MQGNRILYIDLLKAFAIFLVIWGHVIQGYGINSAINCEINFDYILTFHMPLFATLSGFFANPEVAVKDVLFQKSARILLPLAIWSLIYYSIIPVVSDLYHGDRIHYFAVLRNFYYGFTDWGWWFLRSIFFCFIYMSLFMKLPVKSISAKMGISVIFLYVFSLLGIIPNKLHLLVGFIFLYPFFIAGILIRHYWKYIQSHRLFICLFCTIAYFIFHCFWSGWHDTFYDMNTSIYALDGNYGIFGPIIIWKVILRYILGVSASLALICLFYWLCSNEEVSSSFLVQKLSDMGRYTLGIYILQFFVFDYIPVQNLFAHQIIVVPLCLIISIIILFVCYILCKIFSKNRAVGALLFGQK